MAPNPALAAPLDSGESTFAINASVPNRYGDPLTIVPLPDTGALGRSGRVSASSVEFWLVFI